MPPNGMRLSCGREARGRSSARPATSRGRRTNAILPYSIAPASSKRLLGATLTPSSQMIAHPADPRVSRPSYLFIDRG